ncbi:MAG TPA: hypothetical protein DCG75_16070 [Bacteroidales bacterium]|nr:hypothetical protein [Bacteroidales bacterium]
MEQKTTKKRPIVKKVERVSFLVKTKGYKETFNTIDKAQAQFDILRKRAIKNQTPVKIQIYEITKGKPQELVDEVNISESYYEED